MPLTILITLFGLLIGTFLRVPIALLPKERKFFRGTLDNGDPWYTLTLLGGWRRPTVEIATALAFWLLAAAGITGAQLLFYGVLGCIVVVMVFIDAAHMIIPNELVVLALVSGLLLQVVFRINGPLDMALGFFVAGLLLLIVAYFGPLGGGDIKFMAAMGLWLGLGQVVVAIYIGFVLGGLYGLGALLTGKKGLKSKIPFGPFLGIGTWLAALYTAEILSFL